jgi:hypothetical protein
LPGIVHRSLRGGLEDLADDGIEGGEHAVGVLDRVGAITVWLPTSDHRNSPRMDRA